MSDYEMIVVGLGGVGSAAAFHLSKRGHTVLGIERFHPAHEFGSSHGHSRITRMAYAEDPAYVPMMQRSYQLWRQLEHEAGRQLLTMTGGLMLGHPRSSIVSGALRSAQEWGLPHEILDSAEVQRRFPTLTPESDEQGIYEPDAGFVRPETSVLAHTELARHYGANLHHGEPVQHWEDTNDTVKVTTDQATYAAKKLVFCGGPWTPELFPQLDVPLVVERQVMHWFVPENGVELYQPDRHPIYIWEAEPELPIYGFPAQDGQDSVKVAFYRPPGSPTITTPSHIARTVSEEEISEITSYLEPRIPTLPARHKTAHTCMYTMTPDHNFLIGPHPQNSRVIMGAGFSGHGFKFVPVLGEILADLATQGETQHDITLFAPDRR